MPIWGSNKQEIGGAVGDVVDCRVDRPQCTCNGRGIGGGIDGLSCLD